MTRVPIWLLTLICGPLKAEGWIEYIDRSERFAMQFPGEPVVEETTYLTELGVTLPARVYTIYNPPSCRQLQITNPDGSRTFVAIHLEAHRL